MAADPEGSRRRTEALAPTLGGESHVAPIEALLARRALEWARGIAGDDAVVEGNTDVAAAVAPDRPTLIVWPELPMWLPEAGPAALDDLAAGCSVSIGPLFDGPLYLLAFAEPIPELLTLNQHPWGGVQAMARVFGIVEKQQLEVGLIRAERGLRRPDDVAALRADPLTDPELREMLG
jgi:hypothetical protein